MKTVLVLNIPSPYREPVYQFVGDKLGNDFSVLYCKKNEHDRKWNFAEGTYHKLYLKGRTISYNSVYKRHVHFNIGVWAHLSRLDPAIVITNGYNPTHLMAFAWAMVYRRKHVAMTDAWIKSEEPFSFVHKLFRKFLLNYTSAFIGASKQSANFFGHYGAKISDCFQSCLCGNNVAFDNQKHIEKKWDIIFSGQFIKRKLPDFFCDVVIAIKKKKPDLTILLIGSGPLLEKTLNTLKAAEVNYTYGGFVRQEELPRFYCASKILLFPTLFECWGVVVNEACASGMPVITCNETAASGELVIHEKNGYVLPLDKELWAEKALLLLNDKQIFNSFSNASLEMVRKYNYKNSAQGIVDAINHVCLNKISS